jgi:hypothetical protein
MRRVLHAVQQVQPTRMYIHVDGPRPDKPGEAQRVRWVREVATTAITWPCEVRTFFRASHAGLKKGVTGAISWFFEHEEEGIILEDDCLPDPSFFPFAAQMLERYRSDAGVMMIGGVNLLANRMCTLGVSYLFTQHALVWGWASWRRAWQHHNPDFEGLEAFRHSGVLDRMLPGKASRVYLYNKFMEAHTGIIHSWAYAWSYSILRQGGRCILPTVNLINNIGIGDEAATNTRKKEAFQTIQTSRMTFPLVHPEQAEPDPYWEEQLFYTFQKKRYRLWIWYLLYSLHLRGVHHT